MSREYLQLNVQDFSPPPAEWVQTRRYSASSEADIHPAQRSSLGAGQPGSSQQDGADVTSSLLPPPRLGPHRYSTSESDLHMPSGTSTPPMDNRHTSWSSSSLLQPPAKSRWYSQISASEVSLGSYATVKENRQSMWSMSDQNVPGQIVRLHDRDDVEQWKGPLRALYFLAPFLILIDVALYLLYLAFRLYCNIDAQRKSHVDIGPAWIFFAVECLITIPYLMNNGWAMFALKSRNRPRLRLTGNYDLPTVDVFVTCCKEDDQVVMDTVLAACDQDYPLDRFRVIILDDGQSAELQRMATEASKTWPNLIYMSREKKPGVPHHFKAGNLNYGLEQITMLPNGSGEFIGALDADMVCTQPSPRAKLTMIDSRTSLASCSAPTFAQRPQGCHGLPSTAVLQYSSL
jgi:Glycosyl transferase family 2